MADKNLKMDFIITFSVVVANTEQADEDLVGGLCDELSNRFTDSVSDVVVKSEGTRYPLRVAEGVDYEVSCGEEE